ncbi:MAG: glutamate---cysteine ligase / carboxylate-amine ligase [Actinomycetota bacterium]|jgi:carboxylate-amine ligase|nr:glutamate---cysteine ligase / carboxylate-amine ligase [Actinomycetota bacterium]MEA2973369.1 glutamate---cysteine ligase / carboxylate-amine ligase [Actinomycetota bacterium]
MADDFTIGVEEEFFLVDVETRQLRPVAGDVLPGAAPAGGGEIGPELQQCQIETGTGICRTLDEVADEVGGLRRTASAAAAEIGCAIASSGTHALGFDAESSRVTPKPAYLRLEREYRMVTHEQLVCGCHVHIGIADPEVAIQVANRVRTWLPTLLALSGNSPFWKGVDSGYASFRTEVWQRWPMSGTPGTFRSRADYDDLVQSLLAVDAIDDPARIYWDVRPSAKFDTIEFRVADANLLVDESVMTAGLVRGIVVACHRQMVDGEEWADPRAEVRRAAMWRAARFGLEGPLVDLEGCRSRPAADMVDRLLAFVRPALVDLGDWERVRALVAQVVDGGTGAVRQRRAFQRRHRLEDVVDLVVEETAAGG